MKTYFIFCLVLLSILVSSCAFPSNQPKVKFTCLILTENLDSNIYDANDAGDFRIGWDHNFEVGGTLINITDNGFDERNKNKHLYELTFSGKNKQGILFLQTTSVAVLPYKLNTFYQFNLKQLKDRERSAVSSGLFSDDSFDQLTEMNC